MFLGMARAEELAQVIEPELLPLLVQSTNTDALTRVRAAYGASGVGVVSREALLLALLVQKYKY